MINLHGTVLTWLGHASVLITTPRGTTVLIDPFLTQNPAFPKDYKLPEKIDLIFLTHAHFDHTADAVPLAKKYGSTVVAIFELASWIGSKGVEKSVGMNMGGTFQFADLAVTMVEAKHSSSIQDGDQLIYGGDAAGFVIKVEGGPTLYHAGDTMVFSDMQLIRDLYHPEIGFLPIGDHYTMGPKQASLAVQFLGLMTVIPIHFGTLPELTGRPEELAALVKDSGVEVKALAPGESLR
jgi:L-ascorbate metabolism protein UlaG (beta-lactamase superfamily)